ncbi:MAG: hypothetical protein HYS17_10950 [Micavibrio aeruginosavorus]|uniref:Uncharacterized protein n=1 Tax=Micavibrio aeruginosavorus TaxID=349221 RepID=A0A7T5R1V0_9BACT|nr:MAG: hypothetical protein HYS17_10950 [Micavibrio aeruginosavorus]
MPGLTALRFTFMTATSGDPSRLQERAGCADQQDMVDLAVAYYTYYARGENGQGEELVSFDRRQQEAEELNDEPTEIHRAVGMVDASVDADFLEKLVDFSGNDTAEDTLTRALVLLEDICDAHDKGYEIGLMNASESEITTLQLSASGKSPGLSPPRHRLH